MYIVGLEENLFPSQRAAESPDGIEEERRLFYVALTRAKVSATISYAEMRFQWGESKFTRPSCFLREIDPRYIESDADFAETRPQRRPGDDGPAAIDELRRRFDYRFQQKQQGGGRFGGGGNGGSGGYGSRSGSGGGFGRAADGESGPARRFARAAESRRPAAAPDPEVREAGFVLWNLRASLRVNRLLTIFVRGENLLAERYEINAGYPMPRATVFGGLKLNL